MAVMPVNWQKFLKRTATQSELFAEYQAPQPAGIAAADLRGEIDAQRLSGVLPTLQSYHVRRVREVPGPG